MTSSTLRHAVVLGLISAVGPFAIDMYLPALPAIGRGLGVDEGAVQASLMVYFAAIALSQLVYGPASDRFGRKVPLLLGLALFVAGSVGCALAPGIDALIACRVVQGLGGGATLVMPRAIVRDLHTGTEAARLMSLLMLVFSVSPLLAPLLGSLVIEFSGWRAIFVAIAAIGVVGAGLVAAALPETRRAAERAASPLASALPAYRLLLRDRRFLGLTSIGSFGMAAFFVFLGNSSFVLMEHYGLSTRLYSLAFAVNAGSFIGISQLTARLSRRFGLARTVRGAVAGFAGTMLTLLALFLAGADGLPVLVVALVGGFGLLGLVVPATAVLALEEHGAIAGTASALMGTLQLLTGAVVMAIVGRFLDGTPRPMVIGIAACAVVALAISWRTLGGPRAAA
jgi:DHA1 family bicyclomycin/chloramphenicol resistance-like MFS transporter